MAKSWKHKAEITLIAAVALGIVDACAPAAEHKVGEMMVDTGGVLVGMATGGMDGSGGESTGGGQPATGSMLGTAGQMLVDTGTDMMGSGGSTNPAMAQDPTEKSGSRIQLRWQTVTGADGLEYREPFPETYDTQLDIRCMVSGMTDGSTRCTPSTAVVPTVSAALYFADASCTTKLAYTPAEFCPEQRYAIEQVTAGTSQTCSAEPRARNTVRVYALGSKYTGPRYARQGSACVEVSTDVNGHVYRVTEMAPSEFVRLDVTTTTTAP